MSGSLWSCCENSSIGVWYRGRHLHKEGHVGDVEVREGSSTEKEVGPD